MKLVALSLIVAVVFQSALCVHDSDIREDVNAAVEKFLNDFISQLPEDPTEQHVEIPDVPQEIEEELKKYITSHSSSRMDDSPENGKFINMLVDEVNRNLNQKLALARTDRQESSIARKETYSDKYLHGIGRDDKNCAKRGGKCETTSDCCLPDLRKCAYPMLSYVGYLLNINSIPNKTCVRRGF